MKETRVSLYDIEVLSRGVVLIDDIKPTRISLYDLEILSKGEILVDDIKPLDISAYNLEILSEYVPLEISVQYSFEGTVHELTTPVARQLYAYDQTTYRKVGESISTTSGTFVLPSTSSGISFVVCLDDTAGESYNHLTYASIIPLSHYTYGRTPGNPGTSAYDIKQNNIIATYDGIYWIQPAGYPEPIQVYCNMTTAGGGWTLIGKGRQGWDWNDAGKGTLHALAHNPDLHDVSYMSASLVNLLINKPLNTLTDGIRITRLEAINQDIRWKFTTLSGFTWNFDDSYEVEATLDDYTGTHNTREQYLSSAGTNDCTRLFTWDWASHNYVKGFSTGGTCTTGWEYNTEGHPQPQTKVWVRL